MIKIERMRARPTLTSFDLNLLVALDVLLAERSVTRAADRLHLSQSAVSGVLQRLRDQLGDPLLVRVGRELELSPLARSLVEPVREALSAVRAVLETEPSFDPTSAVRVFRLMMSDYCMIMLLPRIVARLAAIAPGVRCNVEPLAREPFDRLESGAVDMCIMTDDWRLFGSERGRGDLNQQHVFADTFVCVMSKDHHSGDALTREEFVERPHVMVDFGEVTSSIEEETLRRLGIGIDVVAKVSSFTGLAFVAAQSPAIAVMQRRLAEQLSGLPLRILPVPFAIPELREAMIWHVRYDRDPGHAWMRELIVAVGQELDKAP